jgi:hypothetical protein
MRAKSIVYTVKNWKLECVLFIIQCIRKVAVHLGYDS